MTEGILIEIAQRFRRLEDIAEAADAYHAEREERAVQKMDKVEDSYKRHQSYDRYRREGTEASTEHDMIKNMRADLELALEACRDDMNRMMDEIRKAAR